MLLLNFVELLLRLSYLLGRPGDHDAERAILLASREVADVSGVYDSIVLYSRPNSIAAWQHPHFLSLSRGPNLVTDSR